MSRDDDFVCREVKAAVTLMVRGVAEEDAHGGADCELVGSRGRQVGVAFEAEDAKVIVEQQDLVKGKVQRPEP